MKKNRLVALLLAFAMVFALTACSVPETLPTLDQKKAWSSTNYEKSTYTVRKYTRVKQDKNTVNGECIAEGTYSTELRSTADDTTVTVNWTMTYTGSDGAVDTDVLTGQKIDNRNCTDTMTSVVRFNSSLSPLYSEKTFTLAPRPEGSMQPHGYKAVVDYQNLKLDVTSFDKATNADTTKTYTIGQDNYYDNEQLLFLIRGLQATTDKSSASFYLLNAYDVMLKNGYFRYNMSLSSGDRTGVLLSEKISDDRFTVTDTAKKENTDDNNGVLTPQEENGVRRYAIDCTQTSVGITGTKTTGPAISFLISDPGITFAEKIENVELKMPTNKLIVQMTYVEYAVTNASEKYNTVYTLDNYTVNSNYSI